MPVPMSAYSKPYWIRYKEKYPMSYNKKDRYNEIEDKPRSYRGGDYKQAGYNPNHNSTRVERVNLKSESIQLKPY